VYLYVGCVCMCVSVCVYVHMCVCSPLSQLQILNLSGNVLLSDAALIGACVCVCK